MSVYAALTALNAQQTKLDVIGNNLANVSTVAYKSQTATFSDLLSQTLSSSSGASTTSNTGGTNAKQIGLGVSVAAISTNVTSGSITSTGVDTDVAINGGGYFIVEGDTTGSYYFTRAGNFGVDAEGNLNVNGYKVCGWEPDADQVIDTEAAVSGINLFYNADGSSKQVIAPEKTTTATMDGTLDSTAEAQGDSVFDIGATTDLDADTSATISVYDALGNEYDVDVDFTKCYSAAVYDEDGTATTVTTVYWEASDSADNVNASGSGYLAFDSTGKLLTGTYYSSDPTVTGSTPETYTFSKTYDISMAAATDASGNKLVNIDDFTVSMDVSAVSLYTEGSIAVDSSDGYASGTLSSYSIGSDGTITGVYSNNQTQVLAQIGLASFNNAGGLDKVGTSLYAASANSGSYDGAVVAGSGGTGSLTAGALEASNVDLSSQFAEMMVAERAYQAASKLITVSDDMMQTVINMVS